MRFLIIEDEPEIAGLLADHLQGAGFESDQAGSIGDAIAALELFPYDLALIDRRLPDGDGLQAIPKIRSLRPEIFIIVVTALDGTVNRVRGLDAGADDYIVKPYDCDELLAHIRARLRSAGMRAPASRIGAMTIDHAIGAVTIGGRPLVLHRREFALLDSLARRPSQVVARATLTHDVYGIDESVSEGALDTLVWRLRRRLTEAQARADIHLVRGRGYMLMETAP